MFRLFQSCFPGSIFKRFTGSSLFGPCTVIYLCIALVNNLVITYTPFIVMYKQLHIVPICNIIFMSE